MNKEKEIVNKEFIDTRIISACPSTETEKYIMQAKMASIMLPESIIKKFQDFSKNGTNEGYLLVSASVYDVPPTPEDNTMHIGEKTDLAKIQATLNQCLGEMISYEAEGNGRLFQDMSPNYKLSKTQTSIGSAVELEIHTEQAFSEFRPDFLSLACLRGDSNAKTFILHMSKILENLTTLEQELLKQPLWEIGVDLSFKMYGLTGGTRGPMPIISPEGNLVFDQDLMRGITDEAEKLRHKIINIYYEHRTHHCLQPGEILFIDNRHVVHGRSPFQPKFDGKDRFIVRTFVVVDYEKSSKARPNNERIVSAICS